MDAKGNSEDAGWPGGGVLILSALVLAAAYGAVLVGGAEPSVARDVLMASVPETAMQP
jgi:hypothetical protein